MNELADTVKGEGRNMTIFGVIAIILGILAMLAPGLAGKSVALLIGVFVIVGGIVWMIWALKAGSLGKGLLMFAIGGLTLICGLALMGNPLFTAELVAWVQNTGVAVQEGQTWKRSEHAADAEEILLSG